MGRSEAPAGMLSVVCGACAQVARVAVAAVSSGGAWSCPACGAVKPALGTPGLPATALLALARAEAHQPVFSERSQRPGAHPARGAPP